MTIDNQISDAKARVGDAERKLAKAKAALFALQCDKAGVHIGDKVRSKVTSRHPVPVTIVVDEVVGFYTYSSPTVTGRMFKKDGSLGNARRSLFQDWEVLSGPSST